ncbi:hypothetical protein [Candidatus Cardinium sp. cBcalN2]|uniref:hypothetical protein n=1 Tax=Candidatus Cardinium sp. cBcalN2 TaxID=2699436 RepID=UPI001FB43B0A|nr:hypothetical protein [Candidatus Cardinium sp. cBcalN2]
MSLYHLFYCFFFKQKTQKSFIRFVYCLLFLCFAFLVDANQTHKIATPHFSIAFDKSCMSSAQRIANTLETIYKPVSKTLGVYPSPLRLLINNKSTELNGSFVYLPRHINFYTLYHPDPNFIGNGDWLSLLCIHEFRHAVQYSIEYHSTPCWLRPLYFGANLIAVCGVPSFFKEGDAVGIETACSKSGRGRLPGWEKVYKANLLERPPISFARQIFGSLKHDIPDEYHIGYYFTTHIRRKYGADSIKAIFEQNVRSLPYFGFYHAIKKVTKKSILDLYKDMNQALLLSWQKQLEGLKITPATQLTTKKSIDSVDYIAPFIDQLGNLIAWKTGMGLRPQLVQVGKPFSQPTTSKNKFSSWEKDKPILYFRDTLPSTAWAIGEGCAAWLEASSYSWQKNRQTIRLQYYDFKQKKRRTLIASSRYVALAIGPSTRQMVAVTSDETGKHFLVVLDTKSGSIVKKIDNPDQGYYFTPSWADADHVIVVKTKDQKNSILRINIHTNATEVLLPCSYEHRSQPKLYKDYLLYNSSYNGIDNIYAMHLPTKACFQVTSRKYGAYLGMVDAKTNQLVFSDYTKNGMAIVAMPFDPVLWTPLEKVEDRSIRYYEPLVAQEENSDILTKVPNHLYPLTKYAYLKESLAFLGPSIVPNLNDRGLHLEPFRLVNLQDTLKVTPYFYQNANIGGIHRAPDYKTTEIGLKVKYSTIYPVVKANMKTTRHKHIENKQFCIQGLCFTQNIDETYWFPGLDIAVKLPYYFTLRSYAGQASLTATINLTRSNKKINHTKTYHFKIKNNSTLSKKDIEVPCSQALSISFTDFNKHYHEQRENLIRVFNKFSFPGIGHHHYFIFQPDICREQDKRQDFIKYSWKQEIKLTYGFPLFYPECGIPLIWFLESVSMEGCYKYNCAYFKKNENFAGMVPAMFLDRSDHTIGTTLTCVSRLLSNKTLPHLTFVVDFDFFKKKAKKWLFDFSYDFRVKFDVFGAVKNK